MQWWKCVGLELGGARAVVPAGRYTAVCFTLPGALGSVRQHACNQVCLLIRLSSVTVCQTRFSSVNVCQTSLLLSVYPNPIVVCHCLADSVAVWWSSEQVSGLKSLRDTCMTISTRLSIYTHNSSLSLLLKNDMLCRYVKLTTS